VGIKQSLPVVPKVRHPRRLFALFALVPILSLLLTLIVTTEAFAATNRVENTDSRINYSGGWTVSSLPIGVHSGGSYTYSSSTGASVELAFMGTSLDWIATRSSVGGSATVSVDRGTPITVNLYAASPEYQAKVWGTGPLPDGFHTVKILRVTGTVNVDAFDISGAIVAYTRLEQGDTNITKTGTWNDYAATGASGGSYGRSSTADASATIWFSGTKIAWIGMKGSTPGIVDVYLDDVKKATLDLYAATAQYQVTVWTSDDLVSGTHHLELVRNKDSLPAEFIVLDAIDIWGGGPTIAPPAITSLSPSSGPTFGGTSVTISGSGFGNVLGPSGVTFGGTNARSYIISGTQITAVAPDHTAGTVRVQVTSQYSGSSADTPADDFTYVDPGVPTITSLSPSSGLTLGGTSVTINGSGFSDVGGAPVLFGGLDATSYTVNSPTKITAVAPPHAAGTVRVQVTSAGGTTADTPADDFTYAESLPTTRTDVVKTTTLVTPGTTWSGTWAPFTSGSAYGGSYLRSSTAGAYVVIAFKGTQLDWVSMKGTTGAIADIYVDGSPTKAASVNLYASPAAYKQNLFSTGTLLDGYHTVKIVRSSSSVSGRYLTIDAVDVAGNLVPTTHVEENATAAQSLFLWDPAFASWVTGSTSSASGGTYKFINYPGANVTINFSGLSIALVAKTAASYGNITLTLDGVSKTVSLYSSATAYKKTVYSSGFLTPGNHTLVISRAGTKSSSSSGYTIDIDAIDLIGELR
jgi:hypothetical protein